MTRNPHPQHSWRVVVGAVATLAVGVGTQALGAEPQRAERRDAREVVRRAPSEVAVGGVTVEQRIARQEKLRAELVAELPDGATRTPIRIELTDQDIADLSEPHGVDGPAPLRIGVVKAITPRIAVSRGDGFDQGVLEQTANGGFVWAVSVTSPQAKALRVHFTDFSLPPKAEMYFYDVNGQAHGPYTGTGRNANGDFWTRSIASDTGVIQLRYNGRATKVDKRAISFVISELAHIHDRSHLEAGEGGVATHDSWPCADNVSCLVDANCVSEQAVAAAKDAVAKIEWIQGPFVNTCSGGLLADTDGSSQIPYFLTANHCFSSSLSNAETWFNYTTDSCNGTCPHNILTGGAPPSDTVGITVLRTNNSSDFTLGTLDEAPPAGAAFLGWNSTPVANSNGFSLFRISNPNFGPQGYSQHDVDTGSPICSGIPRGDWIYSADQVGATMGGSSGSPVVNGNGEVVGQLTGCCGFDCGDECAGVPTNWTIDGAFAAYFDEVADLLDPAGGCSTNADCDDGDPCNGAETCVDGSCQAGTPPPCQDGDGCCPAGCSFSNDNDCPVCNNDGTCDPGEDCNNCSNDCISGSGGASCGDGTCNGSEDCLSCPDDCNGRQNGNPNNRFCCNADGGGDGQNPVDCSDSRCNAQGFSCGGTTDPFCCGDSVCEGAEDSCNCEIDCGAPGVEVCDNGADDDCDGQVDCADADCDGDPACDCGGNRAPCTVNADCCSGNCNGGTCRGN